MDASHVAGPWPALPYRQWRDTLDTLHMEMQILGKVRVALSPPEPEFAHVALYVTVRGISTGLVPSARGPFEVEADLRDHRVVLRTSWGEARDIALAARPVAEFWRDITGALDASGIDVELSSMPQEVDDPIPFPDDTVHATYDRPAVTRFWRALLDAESVLRERRARWPGKAPPVQLWWGSLDLSMSLYTGRPLTPPADADVITRVGATEEVFSAGFWPGDARTPYPAFFAYMSPKPDGVELARWWNDELGEFVLPYEDVRASADPRQALLEFLDFTFGCCRPERVVPAQA